MSPRRPFSVTLLLWLVLILTAWGMIRFAASLKWWDILYEFDARPCPSYFAITGAIWGVAGSALLWGTLKQKVWVRSASVRSAIAWLIEYWFERALFESPGPNLPFALTASVLLMGMIVFISLHASTQYYLTQSEEHEQPDQNSKTA